MHSLKEYQQRALDVLADYFTACTRLGNANLAFYETTLKHTGTGIPYQQVAELPGLPYVCLRMPTGGGKTFVAAHAVGAAAKGLLKTDRCVALWLVPSNAIREQTLNALKARTHPYRQALEGALGPVSVLDISAALSVTRAALDGASVIIVSTMQAFRVEEPEGRKVYESSGALQHHFDDLTDEQRLAIDIKDGVTICSLANVLRIRRPVVIVDEAHNARTPLSFGTLARFRPSCILEFTATPDTGAARSNVLHSVSAAELKSEAMIKLPIRLETKPDWKALLADAVAARSQLEALAKIEQSLTGEYLRPIMLIQAQSRRQHQETLTVDVIKRCLLEDHRARPEEIAVATAEDKDLDGVDLSQPTCPIRYVITIQALREGWDCPFAYVLCSVAELHAASAVEQILGRLMRLPRAEWKRHPELNMAYAFSASQSFAQAANALTDALVQNGFNRIEAKDLIAPMPEIQRELGWHDGDAFMGSVSAEVPEVPDTSALAAELVRRVSYDPDTKRMVFRGVMDEAQRDALKPCFSSADGEAAVEMLYQRSRVGAPSGDRSPAGRGERLAVPMLAIKQGELFEAVDETHFLETPWQLSKLDCVLSEAELPSRLADGQRGEITVSDQGRMEARFLGELQEDVARLDLDSRWSVPELVCWLDHTIPHPDITPQESGVFLLGMVRQLIEKRGISLEQLVQDKYRLREAAGRKIDAHRRQARKAAYQALLFSDSAAPVTVSPDVCFAYDPRQYPHGALYQGAYRFQKHYYPQVGNLDATGEEFECAQFLDQLPEVNYWVKNIERRPGFSFWLPTATDKFYPDFICLLRDGRILVVEYKGEDRWSNADSEEKRQVGELWEARSGGKCLFIMPKGKQLGEISGKIASTRPASRA